MPIILRVTPVGSGPRGAWTNVWDFMSQESDYTDAEATVNYLANAYKDYWAPSARNSYGISSFKVLGLGTGLPTVEIVPTVGPIFGTNAGNDALPAQVALLLQFASVAVRPNRSRKYLPGMTEGAWTGGAWLASTITNMQSFGNEMIAMEDETLAGIQFGVTRVQPPPGAILFTKMTQAGVDPYAAIQRRRRS